MRPKPSEIIAGVRAILADTIAPELVDDHARSRLSDIRAVLAQVDWDDAPFMLKARASNLAEQLSAAADWTPAKLPTAPELETFDAYQLYWETLGANAIETLTRLAAHLVEHPQDDDASALHQGLLEAL